MPFQLVYPDWKDLATGKTLVVVPGSSYTIAIHPGRTASPAFPNDGRWTGAAGIPSLTMTARPREEPAPEPEPLSVSKAAEPVLQPEDSNEPGSAGEGT